VIHQTGVEIGIIADFSMNETRDSGRGNLEETPIKNPLSKTPYKGRVSAIPEMSL